jgi:tetratricopeptide (TPR) repeat protein
MNLGTSAWVVAGAIGLGVVVLGSTPSEPRATEPWAEALAVVRAPQRGDDVLDARIRALQGRLSRADPDPSVLERLGWTFVAKAQATDDPGYFVLAERSAEVLAGVRPASAAGRLLHAHALTSLHRFDEAEPIARELAAERGAPSDWAIYGDVLMERGRLGHAVEAYQRMIDLRPDAAAYARIAHVRQLTGDLDGALAAIEMATHAASPRNRETYAWVWTKRGSYELQRGHLDAALAASAAALAVHPTAAAGLLLRGRVLLAQRRIDDAVAALSRAAAKSPLPDVLWTLADALRAAGRDAEADGVETRLEASGEGADPRGLALFLASRGRDLPRALALARRELGVRRDVHTWAALARAEAAAGDVAAAWRHAQRALAESTADARLAYAMGVVALRAGERNAARRLLVEARRHDTALLPSERAALVVHLQNTTRAPLDAQEESP